MTEQGYTPLSLLFTWELLYDWSTCSVLSTGSWLEGSTARCGGGSEQHLATKPCFICWCWPLQFLFLADFPVWHVRQNRFYLHRKPKRFARSWADPVSQLAVAKSLRDVSGLANSLLFMRLLWFGTPRVFWVQNLFCCCNDYRRY